MSTEEELVQAIDGLERALTDFAQAYGAWLRGDGDAAELRRLLDEAEARLDAARAALDKAQDTLRA